jgi:glycosyltransferase involved in cell wall biosynthesis
MRILFLANYFPPHSLGGQERSCQEVFEGLQARGHECLVLTSMHGVDNVPTDEPGVRRWLYLEMDMVPRRHSWVFFTQRKQRETHNLQRLEQLVKDFAPDVIYVWGMWNLPRSLAGLAERLFPGRVAYRFAEYWPTLPTQHEFFWRAPAQNWRTYLPKRILSAVALSMLAREKQQVDLKFAHVMCVSEATKQVLLEGRVPVAHAQVIHTGLDVDEFLNGSVGARKDVPNQPLKLLYAGRMTAEKGIETIFEALAELAHDQSPLHVHVQLAGGGLEAYLRELREKVARLGVAQQVTFLGRVPAEEMPRLMQSCDLLLVPSIWPEPFARVVLEGMVCRMVVVATPTGGTGEIVWDAENGLLFPAGDSHALAARIRVLAANPDLRKQLAEAGWQTVMQHFTKKKMLDEIEAFLIRAGQEIDGG